TSGTVTIGGGAAGTGIGLAINNGNSTGHGGTQIALGFNGAAQFQQSLRTRHNSGAGSGNAIDFYTWTSADGSAIGSVLGLTVENGGVTIPNLAAGGIVKAAVTSGIVSVQQFSAGAIPFGNGTGLDTDASHLFFDDTTNNFGVGTGSPDYTFEVSGMTRLGGRTGINQDPDNTAGVYFETQITGSTDRVIWNIGGSATALPNGSGTKVYVDWTTNTTSIAAGATVAALFTHRFKRQTFDASSATITDAAPATVPIDGPPNFTGGMTVPASRRALRVELGDVALDAGDLF